MEYSFTEEQEMLKESIRRFFTDECTKSLVRKVQETAPGYSTELFKKMAEMGYCGLMIPEEYGGIPSDWVDAVIFYEEAGRALLQSPHFTTNIIGAQAILEYGSEEQKQEFLPQIAAGKATIAVAVQEQGVSANLSLLNTQATLSGNEYLLNGEKLFVAFPDSVTYILVVCHTAEGPTLLLVDAKSPGITTVPLATLDGQRPGIVTFQDVKVPQARVLGKPGNGAGILNIIQKSKAVLCADMIGGAEAALELGIDYSKQRVVFGQPIGSHQIWQHKMVDMRLAIDKARWLTFYAAWSSTKKQNAAKESAMASLLTGQACTFATSEVIQIHGGIGATLDYDASLYYKRAKAGQLNLGMLGDLQETVAAEIGLQN